MLGGRSAVETAPRMWEQTRQSDKTVGHASVPVVIFLAISCVERWRVDGYFWNKLGLKYTLMWTIAALYFLVHGGGALSLDHILIGREF